MNLGVDVEVEVALLIHADLNCGRPRSIFRDGLSVQDLDGIVPLIGLSLSFLETEVAQSYVMSHVLTYPFTTSSLLANSSTPL